MKSRRRPPSVLNQLAPKEASAVLRLLLEKHPNLRSEIEELAKDNLASTSIDDVAKGVVDDVASLHLEMLTERAGNHSRGYVEPSEAAQELLEEAVEAWVEDMNRRIDAGLAPAAATICAGIVVGLYKTRNAPGNDVVQWAPDFPSEYAAHILQKFFESCRTKMRKNERSQFLQRLAAQAPEWEDILSRIETGPT